MSRLKTAFRIATDVSEKDAYNKLSIWLACGIAFFIFAVRFLVLIWNGYSLALDHFSVGLVGSYLCIYALCLSRKAMSFVVGR